MPRLPDERERPRGHRRRPRPAPCGPSATTCSTRRPARPTRTRRSPSPRPGPRRSSATPPSPSIPTMPATRPWSGGACASRSSSATSRSSRTRWSIRAFGTGAVKITPAHDHDDYATGQRHGLAARRSSPTTRRSPTTGTPLRRAGPLRGPAAIVADLDGARRPGRRAAHEMVIGRCQRSDDVIEPRLKTQWFIRTEPLAARALEATRSGRTRILPEHFEKTWEHWLTNIRDWNVSRQLWWGHRIPAWYCPDGHVTVSPEADGPDACEVCGRPATELQPGPRHLRHVVQLRAVAVLDPRLARRHARPAPLLPDLGHGDRLRHHLLLGRPDDDARAPADRRGALPHRLPVRPDPRSRGQKMSKTKGNVVDPLASSTSPVPTPCASRSSTARRPGNDQRFGPGQARERPQLRQQALERDPLRRRGPARRRSPPTPSAGCPTSGHLGPAERWLLSRAAATTAAVDEAMAGYAFGEVTRLSTTRSGASSATGASSWPRSASPTTSCRRGPRGDLVDPRRGARHVPSPAPSGHAFVTEALWAAIPHRAAIRSCSSWPAGPGWGSATSRSRPSRGGLRPVTRDPQRAGRRPICRRQPGWRPSVVSRSSWADRSRRSAGHRAPGPRPAARARPDPRRPRRHPARRPGGHRPGGELEAAVHPARRSTPRATWSGRGSSASWPRPRAGWRRPATGWRTRPSCQAPRRPSSMALAHARPSGRAGGSSPRSTGSPTPGRTEVRRHRARRRNHRRSSIVCPPT